MTYYTGKNHKTSCNSFKAFGCTVQQRAGEDAHVISLSPSVNDCPTTAAFLVCDGHACSTDPRCRWTDLICDGALSDSSYGVAVPPLTHLLAGELRRHVPIPTASNQTDRKPLDESVVQEATKGLETVCVQFDDLCSFRNPEGGACVAFIVVLDGKHVFVGHIGDCKVGLFDDEGGVLYQSQPHDGTHNGEIVRIVKTGGAWIYGRVNGVLLPSRSFGDVDLVADKESDENVQRWPLIPKTRLIIPVPTIHYEYLGGRPVEALLTSDGPIEPARYRNFSVLHQCLRGSVMGLASDEDRLESFVSCNRSIARSGTTDDCTSLFIGDLRGGACGGSSDTPDHRQ